MRHTAPPNLLRASIMLVMSLLVAIETGCSVDPDMPVTLNCVPGLLGCSCGPASSCLSSLVCGASGICEPKDCTPGEEHCSCDSGLCSAGLVCSAQSVCVENLGLEGGPCFSNRTCHEGLICNGSVCEPCDRGAEGCACLENGSCNQGMICEGNLCSAGQTVVPPANPVCYSPCRQGFTDDSDDFHVCPADGLMPGCMDGAECVEGSCVKTGDDVPSCVEDVDCPDFQVCIQGACYSDCESDAACPAAQRCYRKACRMPCRADEDICAAGTFCAVTDAESGFCLPLVGASGALNVAVAGSFSLSRESVKLSNVQLEDSVTLENDAPRPVTFTLRKLEHSYFDDQNLVVVRDNPLPWLKIGRSGAAKKQAEVEIKVSAAGSEELSVAITAGDETPARWDGTLELESDELGSRTIHLSYSSTPDGRWSGKVLYFSQFGDRNLADWIVARDSEAAAANVGNAFIQKWAALRNGRISFQEFQAVLRATLSESWRWASVKALCAADGHEACYLNSGVQGFGVYSESLSNQPVPSGIVELPIALDLTFDGDRALSGRIVSSETLQYAGDPRVSLEFSGDPAACAAGNSSACLGFVDSFGAEVVVGGRYITTESDLNCTRAGASGHGFRLLKAPWLVPGFIAGTSVDAATGLRYRFECRDSWLPFGSDAADGAQNLSFAGSNPIPDGRSRARTISLVDGALINQDSLELIFREEFSSPFGDAAGVPSSYSAYGIMLLERSNAELGPEAFQGNEQVALSPQPSGILGESVACPAALREQILGVDAGGEPVALGAGNVSTMVEVLLDGKASSPTTPNPLDLQFVHYLCHETGLFDQGLDPSIAPSACPAGSGVTFFTSTRFAFPISAPCQNDGSCGETLEDWSPAADPSFSADLIWRCSDPNQVFCDANRTDLRDTKQFFGAETPGGPTFVPLLPEIDNAFRYKTRFRNRQGQNIGFAPAVCVPSSNAVPYCYDPPEIESVRQRVDCLTHIHANYRQEIGDLNLRDRLKSYLVTNFSYTEEIDPTLPRPIIHDGFERLYTELLVMLGDEAYTAAFQSRFDLAESAIVSFEGSKFEPGGTDLSGVAGFEMYTLYQAVQYYQLGLDRFYSLSPFIQESVAAGPAESFVTQRTVTTYLNRVLRASTQLARSWSEIGKRYQALNRPDLARRAVERAYTASYLESVLVSGMMQGIVPTVTPEERDQIQQAIEKGSLTYRAALLDMREIYAAFTDDVNYFGFPADYVPLPALEQDGKNAFRTLLDKAKEALAVAGTKEEIALQSDRSFETDSAAFQGELTRIRNTYENQLAEICGTFSGDDGFVYPAIRKYAYLNQRAALFGDPCGLMGNGALFEAMAGLEGVGLSMRGVVQGYERVLAEIDIERERVSGWCAETVELADYRWSVQGEVNDLQEAIRGSQLEINDLNRAKELLGHVSALSKCVVGIETDCATAAVALAILVPGFVGADLLIADREADNAAKEGEIGDLQRATARWETLQQCDLAEVDSDARVKTLLLQLKDLDLEALKVDYQLRLGVSAIEKLRNQATRVAAEEEESQQLAINLEAARNDPNVRIYKNDAVINADRTFYAALQAAYRATKVYEYFTSQSYLGLARLGLVRMVSRGDYNLEGYLRELESAYDQFLEEFGLPDSRVDVISLRDDILGIPRYDQDGKPLSQSARVQAFREALADPKWLDGRGYRLVPFSTSLARLSPLTHNHKLSYVEAEIVGSNIGDTLGRVYVTQSGTGVVRGLDGDQTFFRFPERTAVVNPFFNGVRVFTPDVYRNDRLRDRPYVNNAWEFAFNQRDEAVNQDVDLNSLTDIRLFVHYSDSTGL